MNAAYRRMEIVSILVVIGHITARELAQKKFKKCMMRQRGKTKKSWNVYSENTEHIG
ncbi:MAG: hypothetical protein NC124_17815 [Clostridium sp.]|nr:hypothetical protein [Clostridium sp.]